MLGDDPCYHVEASYSRPFVLHIPLGEPHLGDFDRKQLHGSFLYPWLPEYKTTNTSIQADTCASWSLAPGSRDCKDPEAQGQS